MQYLGLTAFNERGNGFVNDRQVDIAVMGISVSYTHLANTVVSTLYLLRVWRLSPNIVHVKMKYSYFEC